MEKGEGQNIDLKTRVANLVEAGFNQEAVGIYGTSVENALQILRSGIVSSQDISTRSLHYQLDATDGGKKNLYYLLMVGDRIKKLKPDLFSKVAEQMPLQFAENPALITEDNERNARSYAIGHAAEDYFKDKTGVSLEHTQIEDLKKIFDGHEQSDVGKVLTPVASEAMKKAIQRKGVLIYFNSKIFEQAEVKPGVEDEMELLAVSEKPLGLDVISGIVPLSDEEREEVLNI